VADDNRDNRDYPAAMADDQMKVNPAFVQRNLPYISHVPATVKI